MKPGNSQETCLCLLDDRMKGLHHHNLAQRLVSRSVNFLYIKFNFKFCSYLLVCTKCVPVGGGAGKVSDFRTLYFTQIRDSLSNCVGLSLISIFFNIFIVYLTLFYVHWCEGVRSPGTGFSDSCELPCGCWELNPGPLEEQSVLLTAEPSLQPP